MTHGLGGGHGQSSGKRVRRATLRSPKRLRSRRSFCARQRLSPLCGPRHSTSPRTEALAAVPSRAESVQLLWAWLSTLLEFRARSMVCVNCRRQALRPSQGRQLVGRAVCSRSWIAPAGNQHQERQELNVRETEAGTNPLDGRHGGPKAFGPPTIPVCCRSPGAAHTRWDWSDESESAEDWFAAAFAAVLACSIGRKASR